jgi:hypothetical protein
LRSFSLAYFPSNQDKIERSGRSRLGAFAIVFFKLLNGISRTALKIPHRRPVTHADAVSGDSPQGSSSNLDWLG